MKRPSTRSYMAVTLPPMADHRHDGNGDEGHHGIFDRGGAGLIGGEAPRCPPSGRATSSKTSSFSFFSSSFPKSQQIAQRDLERLVGRRHVVEVKRVGLHPEKLLPFMSGHAALPAPAEIDGHQQVEVGISVAGEGERRKVVSWRYRCQAPREARGSTLPPAPLLPRPCRRETPRGRRAGAPAGRLAISTAPSPIEERAGRDDNDRALAALVHIRIRRLMTLWREAPLRTDNRR